LYSTLTYSTCMSSLADVLCSYLLLERYLYEYEYEYNNYSTVCTVPYTSTSGTPLELDCWSKVKVSL
jgi:hypothetical protein